MRVALEFAGAKYIDVALVSEKKGGGVPALERYLQGGEITIADFIVEAHDVHHPIGGGLYYEEQKGLRNVARAGNRRDEVCLSECDEESDAARSATGVLHDYVFSRPHLKRYVASRRRFRFNNDDIFRHYRELDPA